MNSARIDIDPSAAEDGPLTVTEVAKIVALHPKVVLEYVRRGELVGQQIGRRWTFTRAAITNNSGGVSYCPPGSLWQSAL
jgi:excisionase family DNA binding protein